MLKLNYCPDERQNKEKKREKNKNKKPQKDELVKREIRRKEDLVGNKYLAKYRETERYKKK